jgi:hypothetical protein
MTANVRVDEIAAHYRRSPIMWLRQMSQHAGQQRLRSSTLSTQTTTSASDTRMLTECGLSMKLRMH